MHCGTAKSWIQAGQCFPSDSFAVRYGNLRCSGIAYVVTGLSIISVGQSKRRYFLFS